MAYPSLRVEPLESERGFRLIGDLGRVNVGAVKETLIPHLHGTLVLDLSALEYVDDDGLGLLIGALKRLRRERGSLVLRNPRPEILRVLAITGMDQIPDLTIERPT